MSTSDSPPTPPPDRRPSATSPPARRRFLRIAVALIGAVILSLVMVAAVRTQGHVTGQEFAPSHFQLRDFRFYEIPLLHLQITPIRRSSQTPTAARYLRQKSLIAAPSGPPTAWHLVRLSRGLTGPVPGDAELLVEPLALAPSGQSYWRQWSQDHPSRAGVLWPVVQRLAERELYLLIPALLEMAQRPQSAEQLQTEIDRQLRAEYRSLVQDMRAAGRSQLADELLREALADYPDDQPLRRLGHRSSNTPTGSP